MPTDTERIDFLQKLTDRKHYTGLVILRESGTGRGWRLHEHNGFGAFPSVRLAIDEFMAKKPAHQLIRSDGDDERGSDDDGYKELFNILAKE